jgi:hypothetical protein
MTMFRFGHRFATAIDNSLNAATGRETGPGVRSAGDGHEVSREGRLQWTRATVAHCSDMRHRVCHLSRAVRVSHLRVMSTTYVVQKMDTILPNRTWRCGGTNLKLMNDTRGHTSTNTQRKEETQIHMRGEARRGEASTHDTRQATSQRCSDRTTQRAVPSRVHPSCVRDSPLPASTSLAR